MGRRGRAQPSCGVRVPCSVGKPRWIVHMERTLTRAVRRWFACGFSSRKIASESVLSLVNMSFCISWRHLEPVEHHIDAGRRD